MDSFQLKLCDIQGRLFVLASTYASESFIREFMNSEVAAHLDSPYNKLQWMGEEYLLEELEEENDLCLDGEKYPTEMMYWIGYLYRYWAISRNESSRKIYRQAPARTMKRNYLMFHTLDPEAAIDDLKEINMQNSKQKHC